MDQALSGNVVVSFASGNDGVGATITDSSTYNLPLEPFIDESAGDFGSSGGGRWFGGGWL